MKDLKSRFLAAIGHVCAAGESASVSFDRLRVANPDAFPVPRGHESFLAACAEVVVRHELTHPTCCGCAEGRPTRLCTVSGLPVHRGPDASYYCTMDGAA